MLFHVRVRAGPAGQWGPRVPHSVLGMVWKRGVLPDPWKPTAWIKHWEQKLHRCRSPQTGIIVCLAFVSHMSSCCLLVIYEDGGDLESMHGIIDISLAAAANLPTFSRFYTVKNSFSTWMNGQGTTWILINIDRNHPPISCSDKTMMMKKGSRESAHTLFYFKNRTLFWWSLPDGRTGIKLFFPNPGNGSCSPGAKRWSATSTSREAAWLLQALKPAEWHFAKPCQPSSGSNVGTSAG